MQPGHVSATPRAQSEARELGRLDGPVLVFGGPHGNLEATAAVLAEAERRRIPWHRVICTGDIAAYCAEPQACAELIRARAIPAVMGNCEEQLAADADSCGCGFAQGSACQALSEAWFAYCRTALDGDAKAWMGTLPGRLLFTLGAKRFAVVHGSPSLINRFVFASTPVATLAGELDAAGTDAVVGGHSGLPFTTLVEVRRGGTRLWHNAGAIGLPANDGTPRVWYSILTPAADGVVVRSLALAYDHERAAAKMRAAGLPEGYAAALSSGLWPSCDVLPPAERSARGRPLAPRTLIWASGDPAAEPGQSRRAS